MQAIALIPGTTTVRLVDRPEPQIGAADEVKLRVLRVGICGTDREEAAGGRADAPAGQTDLVIGHEMFGQVVQIGDAVTRVKVGDYAVFTVRRGCGKCVSCSMNRSDMCTTGEYLERGIKGLDGYQCEFAVDHEQYIVRVPPELEAVGVLTEPLTVVEKAIDEVVRVQSARLPDAGATPNWLFGRRCLIAGLGPIGLLAAIILRLRGAEVYGMDVVDENSARPQWLAHLDGKYIDGRQVAADKINDVIGAMDVIVEATGVAALEFNLIDALGINGAYVLTGIPGGDRPLEIPGAELVRRLVLENQVLIGSVNAARAHFQMAVDDLLAAHLRWGDHVAKLITNRHPSTDFQTALTTHEANEIKVVIEWTK
ncbi:MAG: glucose 1-dehydrogenase [Herpetosiphonaceae bacterium]|nr:glucose 1-dehydrogenase [Herpetosiphonaceae bacterium]